jgi:CheY-like chemotaxis protein
MTIPYGPILVVEDIPNILDLLQMTLTFKGYPVNTARDGEEALAKIEEERPSLIITDVLMPKLDGFSLTHRLRNNPLTRDIPVVMISATYIGPEDKAFARRLGAVQFLEKPVDTNKFLLTVAELLTQGPPPLPEPLSDQEFFQGYRERLEEKLQQKNKQINRTKRLLESLPKEQVATFEALLEEELTHRASIQKDLDDLYKIMQDAEDH